jgi:hypothetical protein
LDLQAGVTGTEALIDVTINGMNVAKKLEGIPLSLQTIGYFTLPKGTNKVKVRVRSGSLKLDYLELK